MSTAARLQATPEMVLMKAFDEAAAKLAIDTTKRCKIIGISRSTYQRSRTKGFPVRSNEAELQALFVMIYRSLYALSGGDMAFMRHWVMSHNQALNGKPMDLIEHISGLVAVKDYLDALRGKTKSGDILIKGTPIRAANTY